jgi:hypothetical protein
MGPDERVLRHTRPGPDERSSGMRRPYAVDCETLRQNVQNLSLRDFDIADAKVATKVVMPQSCDAAKL